MFWSKLCKNRPEIVEKRNTVAHNEPNTPGRNAQKNKSSIRPGYFTKRIILVKGQIYYIGGQI